MILYMRTTACTLICLGLVACGGDDGGGGADTMSEATNEDGPEPTSTTLTGTGGPTTASTTATASTMSAGTSSPMTTSSDTGDSGTDETAGNETGPAGPETIVFAGTFEGTPFSGTCTKDMATAAGQVGDQANFGCDADGFVLSVIIKEYMTLPASFSYTEARAAAPDHAFELSVRSPEFALMHTFTGNLESATVDGTWDSTARRMTLQWNAVWSGGSDPQQEPNGDLDGSLDIVLIEG